MTQPPIQLRDLVVHKTIEIVGMVVFIDQKRREYRVKVDQEMPVETWSFSDVQFHQKG